MSNDELQRETGARDAQLSALYQRTRKDEPPAPLDAAILAAAHREVAAGPQRANASGNFARWRMPLALAATLVLGISVVTAMRQHQPHQENLHVAMIEPAPTESQLPEVQSKLLPSKTSEPAQAPHKPVAEMVAALTPPAAPVARDRLKKSARVQEEINSAAEKVALAPPLEKDATRNSSKAEAVPSSGHELQLALAPLAAPEAKAKSAELATPVVVAQMARDQVETEANSQEVDQVAPAKFGAAELSARRSAPAAISATVGSEPSNGSANRSLAVERPAARPAMAARALKPIGTWLKEIAQLRVEGHEQEGAQQLQLFKNAYPDIPEEKITSSLSAYEREWREAAKTRVVPAIVDEKK
jgi:hypothetical protein